MELDEIDCTTVTNEQVSKLRDITLQLVELTHEVSGNSDEEILAARGLILKYADRNVPEFIWMMIASEALASAGMPANLRKQLMADFVHGNLHLWNRSE